MEEIKEKLDKIMNLLILVNRMEIKKFILENITEDDELLLYQKSDGENTIRKLNEITEISTGKISSCWEKWERINILEKLQNGRGKRLFDLNELDIGLSS